MTQEFDDIRIVHINAGDEESADITIEYNAKRINISLFAANDEDGSLPEVPVEDRIIGLLNEAVIADDEDYDNLSNNALTVIIDVGQSLFSEVAPRAHQLQSAIQDLQSLMYPEFLNFRLQTINNKATIFQVSPDEGVSLPNTPPEPHPGTTFQPNSQLSCYSAKDIVVQEIFVDGNGIVGRVQFDGQDMLCKTRRVGLWDYSLERELTTLQKIQNVTAQGNATIHIPKLHGYVIHAQSSAVIGLVREWIPSSSYGNTLRDIQMSAVPHNVRQKWANQIRQTVASLHDIGIIWGDGKPCNIIIDHHNDAKLIDFAGGWSHGWIDEELSETVEGDDQAVERIIQLLEI